MFATIAGPLPPRPDLTSVAERLRAAIELQVEAGIGLLTDGGVHGADVDPVEAWRAARDVAGDHPVKAVLAGPFGGTPVEGSSVEALRATIVRLAEAGCPVIQVDEPDLARLGGGGAADGRTPGRFLELHRRLADGLGDAVHLHLSLGAGAEALGDALFELPYRSVGFDLIGGPDDWRIAVRAPGDRGLVCGAIDPAAPGSGDLETAIWAAGYAASTMGRGPDRVGLAIAPGLERLTPERAAVKLRILGEAARLATASREELEAVVDPRATIGPRRGRGR